MFCSIKNLDSEAVLTHCQTAENADWLRAQLSDRDLVAFVANGSTLPRQSGVDERPLKKRAVPFQSPESLKCKLDATKWRNHHRYGSALRCYVDCRWRLSR